MVKIKSSKNRMTFAAENFKVRNRVVIYKKKRSLIIVKFERAKRAGKKFDDFIAEMTFKVKKLG